MKKVIITVPGNTKLISVTIVKGEERVGLTNITISNELEKITDDITEIDMTEEATSED
jgi:hypothetical protein